jgi:hypothetical protein
VNKQPPWSEDEDNNLYFAWHHQTLVGDKQPIKQFWKEIHGNYNQRTSADYRSLTSMMNRWDVLVMRHNRDDYYRIENNL